MLPLSAFTIDLISDDLLLLASILVFFAVLTAKLGSRIGVPTLLLFLILGMVAGADGLGVRFDDHEMAESIGHFAMTIILFTGGFSTSFKDIRPVLRQGIGLSTIGVLLTCTLTGGFIYLVVAKQFGIIAGSLLSCFMMAAVMSSTDSASVFSILRGKRMHLKHNLAPMLELESGSNDPMAYVLTILLVDFITSAERLGLGSWALVGNALLILFMQFVIGALVGIGVGYGATWLIKVFKLPGTSLYSILVLCVAFFANGVASKCYGNGLLALYVAALILGNKAEIPNKKDVHKFLDGMTWLMQLLMFLVLGLLARPSKMPAVALPAILIGLFMMFVARPLSVFASLLPERKLPFKAKLFVSWVGLKGAGPILFALCPVAAGLEGSTEIFNIVFLITLLSLLLQGMTLTPLAQKLGLCYEEDPKVETFGMDIPEEMGMLRDHTVTEEDLAGGSTLRDLHLPHGIRVMMVRRGERFLVPHGSMPLEVGDRLVIIMGESDDD